MPKFTVSPGNQTWSAGLAKVFAFHSLEGRIPDFSPLMSMPVVLPKPKGARKVAMRSMPSTSARP